MLRPFGKIVAVNNSIKERLSINNKNKTIIVENGGPILDDRKPNKSSNINKLDFIFYGAFNPYINLSHIFKAFDLLEKDKYVFKLNIIGFGPELDKLKKLCLPRDWATYIGLKDYDNFKNFVFEYPNNLVALIPMGIRYRSSDLKPIKLFEYLSVCLPIIYADCVASDIFEDNVNGFKYKTGDSYSFYSSLKRSIENKDKINSLIEKIRLFTLR